jgi:hypothetical protein
VIAKSSVREIQEQTEHAGLPPSEQLDWILDKPGVTAAQLRQVSTVIETINIELSPALVAKIQKRFPKVPIEDLFSGELPNDLIVLGAQHLSIATWVLAGAAPESILRTVAAVPDLIDEWCAMLTATGVGYSWVRQLGGTYNDKLLRRFALKCPDASTRAYVEQRLLGEGDAIAHDTVAAPVAAPTAYTSSRSHLDADLDAEARRPATSERSKQIESDTIVADVGELTTAEIEGLRHNATRLGQVLATANQKTFAQIIDQVRPTLPVVIAHATPANVTPAHLMSAIQGRPASEVVTTLSSPLLVSRVTAILGSLGPLEVFPASATPAVLAPVLHRNPEIIEWLLVSEPAAVIRALAAPSVIDAAVRALATLDDLSALDAWPSADVLGPGARSVLVQLHARAKGALREALDAKLSAKQTATADGEAAEDSTEADRNARTLHGQG